MQENEKVRESEATASETVAELNTGHSEQFLKKVGLMPVEVGLGFLLSEDPKIQVAKDKKPPLTSEVQQKQYQIRMDDWRRKAAANTHIEISEEEDGVSLITYHMSQEEKKQWREQVLETKNPFFTLKQLVDSAGEPTIRISFTEANMQALVDDLSEKGEISPFQQETLSFSFQELNQRLGFDMASFLFNKALEKFANDPNVDLLPEITNFQKFTTDTDKKLQQFIEVLSIVVEAIQQLTETQKYEAAVHLSYLLSPEKQDGVGRASAEIDQLLKKTALFLKENLASLGPDTQQAFQRLTDSLRLVSGRLSTVTVILHQMEKLTKIA